MLGSALRGPARDLHGGACPAPGERDTGWPEAGREWGTRDSGSGLHRPSPVRLLAPPPGLSRKVPKRSPNVRKRNFLFPTLERAALRWLRGDLGTLLRRGRRPGVEEGGKLGGDAEAPSSSFPLPDPAPLSAGRLFPPPLSSPPSCSSLRGQGSPPPHRRAGGIRINPPHGLSPFPSPAAPGLAQAGLCARARGGRGPRRPLPVCPVGIRPGAGTREGEGGRAPLFKLVSFPRRRPRLRLLCAGVCPDRPTHPTSLLGGWGRLLKGSELGSGARGLGPRRESGVG